MNTLRQFIAHCTADRTSESYASIGRRGSTPGHVAPGQSATNQTPIWPPRLWPHERISASYG